METTASRATSPARARVRLCTSEAMLYPNLGVDAKPSSGAASWLARSLPPALFALLVLTVYADPLLTPRVFVGRDLVPYGLPIEKATHDAFARGRLPAWNADVSGGRPLFPNPNAGPFYPLRPLLARVPFPMAMRLFPIAHWVIAGLGAYFLLRALGGSGAAAWMAAVTYAFSGVLVSEVFYLPLQAGAALLPWTLWATARTSSNPWRKAAMLGLVYGLLMLGGDVFAIAIALLRIGALDPPRVAAAGPGARRRGARGRAPARRPARRAADRGDRPARARDPARRGPAAPEGGPRLHALALEAARARRAVSAGRGVDAGRPLRLEPRPGAVLLCHALLRRLRPRQPRRAARCPEPRGALLPRALRRRRGARGRRQSRARELGPVAVARAPAVPREVLDRRRAGARDRGRPRARLVPRRPAPHRLGSRGRGRPDGRRAPPPPCGRRARAGSPSPRSAPSRASPERPASSCRARSRKRACCGPSRSSRSCCSRARAARARSPPSPS